MRGSSRPGGLLGIQFPFSPEHNDTMVMSGIPSPSRSSSSLTSTLAGSPFGGIFPDGFSMRVWISFVSFFSFRFLSCLPPVDHPACGYHACGRKAGGMLPLPRRRIRPSSATRAVPPFNVALQRRPSPPFPKSLNEFRAGDRRASRESPIPNFAKFPLLKFPLRVLHRAVGRCAEPAPASNADTPR